MTDWRVAAHGRLLGVFTEEALRAARERGEVPSDARVWREGMDDWGPIGRYFPRRRRRERRGGWRSLALLLASLAYLAGTAAAVLLIYAYGSDLLPLAWVGRIWWGVGGALLAFSLIAPLLWGLRAGATELGGLVRIMAVLFAICGLTLSGFELFQARFAAEVAEASLAMRDYALTYHPEARTLVIEGHVGPGLTRALERQFDQHEIRRVDIASPGGLVDEALAVARLLESHKVEVAARSFCVSACVIVLMGGEKRLADYDMDIHFHAVDGVISTKTEWWAVMVRQQARASNAYMIRRGAPEAALREASRLGPSKLYRVPAIDLVGGGMLTGLLDADEHKITAAQARAALKAEDYAPAPAGAMPNG